MHLGSSGSEDKNSNSYVLSAMYLRAFMIEKLGGRSGDPILDVRDLTRWFFDSVQLTRDEAARRANSLRNLGTDEKRAQAAELLQLRRLKNRIGVLKVISGNEECQADEELKSWIALWGDLP